MGDEDWEPKPVKKENQFRASMWTLESLRSDCLCFILKKKEKKKSLWVKVPETYLLFTEMWSVPGRILLRQSK